MDSVPLDFSERVVAMRKCCNEEVFHCRCVFPSFEACKWKSPKTIHATVHIVPGDGEWKYYFRVGVRELTVSELLEHPDFKRLQIDSILINDGNNAKIPQSTPVTDVGMKKLLNLVSFLANEPYVYIRAQETSAFDSPEGMVLFNWLEERWFSCIGFEPYHSICNQLVRKQLTRRSPTLFKVLLANKDPEYFALSLTQGRMTRLHSHSDTGVLDCDVMKGIVLSFLCAPGQKKVEIDAYFDYMTKSQLLAMAKDGLGQVMRGKFIFENPFLRLEVSNDNARWKCNSVCLVDDC